MSSLERDGDGRRSAVLHAGQDLRESFAQTVPAEGAAAVARTVEGVLKTVAAAAITTESAPQAVLRAGEGAFADAAEAVATIRTAAAVRGAIDGLRARADPVPAPAHPAVGRARAGRLGRLAAPIAASWTTVRRTTRARLVRPAVAVTAEAAIEWAGKRRLAVGATAVPADHGCSAIDGAGVPVLRWLALPIPATRAVGGAVEEVLGTPTETIAANTAVSRAELWVLQSTAETIAAHPEAAIARAAQLALRWDAETVAAEPAVARAAEHGLGRCASTVPALGGAILRATGGRLVAGAAAIAAAVGLAAVPRAGRARLPGTAHAISAENTIDTRQRI